MAINTLSYSEMRAVAAILAELMAKRGTINGLCYCGPHWHLLVQ